MGRGVPHSGWEVVVYFIRNPPSSSAPSANTAAGLEDPRRLARRAGCRWGAGSLDSVDRVRSLPKPVRRFKRVRMLEDFKQSDPLETSSNLTLLNRDLG